MTISQEAIIILVASALGDVVASSCFWGSSPPPRNRKTASPDRPENIVIKAKNVYHKMVGRILFLLSQRRLDI